MIVNIYIDKLLIYSKFYWNNPTIKDWKMVLNVHKDLNKIKNYLYFSFIFYLYSIYLFIFFFIIKKIKIVWKYIYIN